MERYTYNYDEGVIPHPEGELVFYKDAQALVEALQRDRSQLQALVRALPKVSEVTSDTVVNIVQQYSFHAWMLKALQLRATLDATTPAGGGKK